VRAYRFVVPRPAGGGRWRAVGVVVLAHALSGVVARAGQQPPATGDAHHALLINVAPEQLESYLS